MHSKKVKCFLFFFQRANSASAYVGSTSTINQLRWAVPPTQRDIVRSWWEEVNCQSVLPANGSDAIEFIVNDSGSTPVAVSLYDSFFE